MKLYNQVNDSAVADHAEISINIWFFCYVFMQPQGANCITREKGLIGHETLQSSQ